ncbi:hypothetical protein CHUAL_004308 [Chamberlinius hualienensis]
MAPFAGQMQPSVQPGMMSLLSPKQQQALDASVLEHAGGLLPGEGGRMKCVLVGDGAVGKTSLAVSYSTNGYPREYVPTAFDNYNVRVTVDNQPLCLQICDTAGQDDFDALRPLCYPGTDVFLICFSVVSPTSFYNIRDKWVPEIKRYCPAAPIILVGTQCDLRSDVKVLIELASYQELPITEMQAKTMAKLLGTETYIESSALTQKNLKEVFDTAIMVGLQHSRQQLDKRKEDDSQNNNLSSKSFYKYKLIRMTSNRSCGEERIANVVHSSHKNTDKKARKGWKKLCCLG